MIMMMPQNSMNNVGSEMGVWLTWTTVKGLTLGGGDYEFFNASPSSITQTLDRSGLNTDLLLPVIILSGGKLLRICLLSKIFHLFRSLLKVWHFFPA